ncbi:MAG TPA: hypothetical protein VJT69_07980, partial [Pyrinomonadaceae bacterium]|nr:hypothetical protein [Pyrinomonadaceae bacterium]
ETKYRLPHSARAERPRLDELRTKVVDRAFSMAFERVGLADDAEVCLRNLSTKVSLSLHSSDQSLVAHWSTVMADEIVRAIGNASSLRAVVYHSRRQALIDFAISVSRGDLRRAWAWRQMGFWQSRNGINEGQAVFELVHSLCSEPAMIVPALRVLAEAGSLPPMAECLTEEQCVALAFAALSEIGASDLLRESSAPPSARAVREARKLINSSLLLRAIMSSHWVNEASDQERRSIAALAIAEVEPALLKTAIAPAVIKIIVDSCAQASIHEDNWSAPDSEHSANTNSVALVVDQPDHQPSDTNGDLKPVDLRTRVLTRWGGLFFLCGVLEDLNIPDIILDHPLLSRRPFSWVLHQLALNLVAIAPDDPAALVFAGRPVKAKPPSSEEEPASLQEAEALREIVTAIDERLSSILDFQDEPPANVIDFVCHRRAEIVADPGWIELRFSLDDVSTELRRAGLDLDPGYVSYLGFVLKFAYE